KAPHMGIDGSGVDHTFVAPDFIEQTVAGVHAASFGGERMQEFKLDTGQVDRLAVDEHAMAHGVDNDCPGDNLTIAATAVAASKNCLDAENHFTRTEWF